MRLSFYTRSPAQRPHFTPADNETSMRVERWVRRAEPIRSPIASFVPARRAMRVDPIAMV